ncbi:MAG: orotidine-5'-phosphate decarboxylase [Deltaproteobacteria bacterium]|nr:orotidine-5'-phosphate decarboxylase [Deltaproteobacteria bacterium]
MNDREFSDRLITEIDKKRSVAVVGLDPVYQRIPLCFREVTRGNEGDLLKAAADAIIIFNKCIIDIVEPYVPAVKPQIAFYERYGIEGIKAFVHTVEYARNKGLIVIEDAKRNDIGNTAQAYADGHIGMAKFDEGREYRVFGVDAITINPYLGSDGINPFLDTLEKYNKGIFVLVKTSNPSSSELQDIVLEDGKTKLFEYVAKIVNTWGDNFVGQRGYSSVGAVVGATFPEHARVLRSIMPKSIFLVPGYGAQGAAGKDITECFNKDGYGAIVSASRSINYPHGSDLNISEDSFKILVENAVQTMNSDISEALSGNGLLPW